MNNRIQASGSLSLRKQNLGLVALALLAAPLAMAQAVAPAASPKPESAEDTIELSPFIVDSTKDKGYYAENTLAGSRMNTNIGDLAASISVVTKQQMEDTASLDINDVFRYEVGTEGSATYTPQVIDRGTFKDTIAGYTLGNDGGTITNAQSNRVRGLSSPEAGLNYFQVNSRIPLDAYNTQSIEISRGPNSMLFGLGSPAGIVNQTATQASVNKNTGSASFRTDQYGSVRTSVDLNQVLLKGKLGIYGAALYNKQQFDRKPSYDTTKRFYGALTYKPFKKTTLRAFVETYNNHASRPNSITPRDFVSDWFAQGRPAYDPTTRMITKLDTNQSYGPYLFSTSSPGYNAAVTTLTGTGLLTTTTSPYYLQGIGFDNTGRVLVRVNGDNEVDVFARQPAFFRPAQTNPATASVLPTGALLGWTTGDARYAMMDRSWTASVGRQLPTIASTTTDYYGTYYYSGVNNKSLYDWTKYNVNQANFSSLKAKTYNVELEQELLPNLFLSAAWLRQDVDSVENNTISQLTGATLAVDTNLKKPDGSVNPYFGLPFIAEGNGPDTFFQPQIDDNARVMLAYNLDLSQKNNWLKWLGNHRPMLMWNGQSRNGIVERWRNGTWVDGDSEAILRYRTNLAIPGAAIWSATGLSRYYYMANPGDAQGVVTHSTGSYGNRGWNQDVTSLVRVYDYNFNTFKDVAATYGMEFADNGSKRTQRRLGSWSSAIQSNFFSDRLITTFGARKDDLRLRNTTLGAVTRPDGTVLPAYTTSEIFQNGIANYDLVMNSRWTNWERMEKSTSTAGVAFRPLKGWRFSQGDGLGAEFLNGLTFYYNESSNWNPPTISQTDYFKNPLPKPTGDGKDMGFGVSLLKNKLVGRITWFETKQVAERSSTASTLMTRIVYGDSTLMQNWASAVVRLRNGANPLTDPNWNNEANNPVNTPARQAEVWALMQLPVNYYTGIAAAGTQNNEAKGVEVQFTYNPTPNWSMKFTGSKQETKYNDVAPEYDTWLAARMPVWTSAVANDIPDFVDAGGTAYSLKKFWASYGYSSAAKITNTDGNTNAENYFNNTVVSQEATARALEGAISPLQSKYRASFLTNYNFTEGKLKGWGFGMAERYQSATAVGYYGKKADPTKPKLIGATDVTRPIYGDAEYYTDLWVSYSRKICNGKLGLKVQFNVGNVFEPGGLQVVAVNWDGSPWSYRIVDPRQFTLTTTVSF